MTSSVTQPATSKEQISSHPVAVVTGAAKGIGRALVDVLLDRGYIVIPVVRTQNDLRELFALSPERVFPVRCDVTEASTESALHDFVESLTGRVDILFNNAGHGATGYGIGNLDLQELDRVYGCALPRSHTMRARLSTIFKESTKPFNNQRLLPVRLIRVGGI